MNINVSASDFLYRFAQTFFKHSLTLFIYYYSAYKLDPEIYGKLIYYVSIAAFILILCDFGISNSTSKFIAELKDESEDKLKAIFSSVLFFVFLLSIILCLLSFWLLNTPLFDDKVSLIEFSILIVYLVITPLNSVIDGFFMGKKAFNILFKINATHWLITIITNYLIINLYGYYGALVCFSLNSLIFILVFLFYEGSLIVKQLDLSIVKSIFRYSLFIGISSVAYFLYTRFDIFVLESFSYIKEIGYYEIINRLFTVLIIPIAIVGQVQAPRIAYLNSRKEIRLISQHFKKSIFIVFIFGIVVSILFYYGLPPLLNLFLSDYYNNDFSHILTILLAVVPLKFVGVLMTIGFITPTGFAKITMYVTIIFGILNVALDYIFILHFGFIGVFWATLLVHNTAILVQIIIYIRFLNNEIV